MQNKDDDDDSPFFLKFAFNCKGLFTSERKARASSPWLSEKSEHERPGPERDDAFWSLIFLQPRDRLTSGLL